MLTINENATAKNSNMKKLIAAISSVAVIGAGATYMLSTKTSSNVNQSKLAQFFEDDFNGSFKMSTLDEKSYTSKGLFSKTSDANGEWDLEFSAEGIGEEKDGYFLKDDSLYQMQTNDTYACTGIERNIGYAKYKYNLINAVEVERNVLSDRAYSDINTVCEETSTLFLVENEDVGTLIICPNQGVNGSKFGIVAKGFKAELLVTKGEKKIVLPKANYPEEKCENSKKFHSQIDEEEGRVTELKKDSGHTFSTTKSLQHLETFPFQSRQLQNWDDRPESGPVVPWGGFSTLDRDDPNNSEGKDCQFIHGAGNNKGFRRQWSANNGRYVHDQYESHHNDAGNINYPFMHLPKPLHPVGANANDDARVDHYRKPNSRTWGPCWIYPNIVLPSIKVMPALANKKYYGIDVNGTTSSSFTATYNDPDAHRGSVEGARTTTNHSESNSVWEYPGYNYYWGNNMLRTQVPNMPPSAVIADQCTWVTFNDHNSNQHSYQNDFTQRENAIQICGRVGCFAGNQGYESLVIAHSMGTMTVLGGLANGWWKKGEKSTVALVAAPAKGSIGPMGVNMTCSASLVNKKGTLTGNVKSHGGSILKQIFGYTPNVITLAVILTATSSCADTQAGQGVYVINALSLWGPQYFNNKYRENGLIDYRYCGYTASGLDANAMMSIVNKLACRTHDTCLQLSFTQQAYGSTIFTCHYRGCNFGYGRTSSKKNWKYLTENHDNHVSMHSCMATSRYFGWQRVQTGSHSMLSAANHKNICCKKGDSILLTLRPCNWYKSLIDGAI